MLDNDVYNGFSNETLSFLGKLRRNNNREWFEKNRATYESQLVAPAKLFVIAMAQPLLNISPDINAEPRINAAIRRINRDIRFSADKRPYKDHLDFSFRYSGGDKEGPGFFLRVMQKSVVIGAGAYMFDKEALVRYRDAVADTPGKALAQALARVRKAGYEIGGSQLKRVPRGYDAEHARADLLRYSGLYAYSEVDVPDEFYDRRFAAYCARHFTRLAPLASWLATHVLGGVRRGR